MGQLTVKRGDEKSQELLMQSEEETAKKLVSSDHIFNLDHLLRSILGCSPENTKLRAQYSLSMVENYFRYRFQKPCY